MPAAAPPPDTPYGPPDAPIHEVGGLIWAPLRHQWRQATPEERVRQQLIYRLHAEYGYALEQMAQEVRTQSGHRSSRADVVICIDVDALKENRDYRIVAETKAENVAIQPEDFWQGESYARAVGAEFLIMHNLRETQVFRLSPGAPGKRTPIEDVPSAADLLDDKKLEELRRSSKPFVRDEFRRLLFECHSVLRDNHKMDPGSAFDEISKILFVKMHYERLGQHERFTTEYIDRVGRLLRKRQADLPDFFFEEVKEAYADEDLFEPGAQLRITYETFRRLVEKLERFNLSATSEDIKGIAFERFLGQTFRGDLGQYFTPRPIVEFMVEMLGPQEGELICDPACGTGGFLIKAFEHVRQVIESDIQRQKAELLERISATTNSDEVEAVESELEEEFRQLNQELDPARAGSRMHRLASSLFGVDAEARAARTAKMNMIMHGDGHSGIIYHDGLLDYGDIYVGRFNIVLTNPPFGSTVGDDQLVGTTPQTSVPDDKEYRDRYAHHGDAWLESYNALREAAQAREPLLHQFDIGRDPIGGPIATSRTRPARPSELLFVERSIDLVVPGGRIGIVLPEGVLNNPRESWFRRYVESRAHLLAVVSIPHEVFASADATVKTSLVFLQRFTEDERRQWEEVYDSTVEQERLKAGRAFEVEVEALAEPLSDGSFLASYLESVTMGHSSRAISHSRRNVAKALSEIGVESASDRLKGLEASYKKALEAAQEEAHNAACRAFNRRAFMAEVTHAGITSTGATGPEVENQLTEVLKAYRRFLEDPAGFDEEYGLLVGAF